MCTSDSVEVPIIANRSLLFCFFFQAEDGIRDLIVTGVQTCALPISGHGVAGLTGGLLTGILANPAVTQYVAPGLTGALFGNINQLGIQAFAAAVTVVYVFAISYGLLKLIGRFTPLQESPENLKIGDAAIHGEIGIDLEDA